MTLTLTAAPKPLRPPKLAEPSMAQIWSSLRAVMDASPTRVALALRRKAAVPSLMVLTATATARFAPAGPEPPWTPAVRAKEKPDRSADRVSPPAIRVAPSMNARVVPFIVFWLYEPARPKLKP